MALDPVCGMTVEPATAAGQVDYQGQTYYFCSKHCVQAFSADPGKYLGAKKAAHPHHHHHAVAAKIPVRKKAEARAGAKYTCPMHPEIVRDAPGDCPKCGMALVPIAGSGEADDRELRGLTTKFW